MIIDLENLPFEATILHQIIEDLLTENQTLKDQLALLKAKRFGKSSERLEKQISELELRIEENESLESTAIKKEDQECGEEKQCTGRKKLPDHLACTDIILNPEPICPSCGGEEFRKISDDVSETLEYIPSSFKVIRYVRPRCACIGCEQIVQACTPSKAIEKGKAGAGLLSHILVQKYCNHLPLYRQSQIYEREGIELSRSTMASWAQQCSKLLEPLLDELKQAVFSSEQLHGDDTPVKVLAPGIGKTQTGRIWAYVRDGRPYGDRVPPAVCYFYSPDRKSERPAEHLKDFTGILHADAYAGYNNLYIGDENEDSKITEAACWAHVRRKFYEVTVASDNASIAIATLEEIGKVYKIEEEIKGLCPDDRVKHRQESSKGLVENLFISFKKAYGELPKKSITAKAIAYAMNKPSCTNAIP